MDTFAGIIAMKQKPLPIIDEVRIFSTLWAIGTYNVNGQSVHVCYDECGLDSFTSASIHMAKVYQLDYFTFLETGRDLVSE